LAEALSRRDTMKDALNEAEVTGNGWKKSVASRKLIERAPFVMKPWDDATIGSIPGGQEVQKTPIEAPPSSKNDYFATFARWALCVAAHVGVNSRMKFSNQTPRPP
jgi:hypothetical protein